MALTYSYISATDSYSVVSNSCTAGAVVIPSTHDDGSNGSKAVTSIGASAFQSCTSLTSVTIPDSVTSIEGSAFRFCSSLASVTLPTNINFTSIANAAFQSCTSLTSIIIPNSVTIIGSQAFSGCTSLTNIIIPNSVTRIESSAFSACPLLTSVTIGNSVTRIEDSAFRFCLSLTSLTIPNSVTSIGISAFRDCTGLTSVTIGNSMFRIGNSAFADCTDLTSVYFLGNPPTLVGINIFQGTNVDLKIYRKKNFVTRWSSTFGGIPVVLISNNVVKGGGTGKLTTKKRTFGLPNEIYLTITGCDALCTGGWCKFDGDFASYPFNRGGNDQFGLGSKRWYNDGNDIMIIYDGDEGYFNMANHWLIIDPYEQLLYFKRPSSDPNNIPTDGWQVGVETLCQNGQVIISK